MSPEMTAAIAITVGVAVGIPFWLGTFLAFRKAWSLATRWLTGQFADAFEQGHVEPTKSLDERPEPEGSRGQLRDLAIDAALHRLVLAKHPTLSQFQIQKRSRTTAYSGECYYTVSLDGNVIARVDLISSRRFSFEIIEAGDKP